MSLSSFGLPLSESPPEGPQFIDSGNCLCALQEFQGADQTTAWRCLGSNKKNQNIYQGVSGKWYKPETDNSAIDPHALAVNDDSLRPNNHTAFVAEPGSRQSLVALNSVKKDPLSIFDRACTGHNVTELSQSYYGAQQQIANKQTPTAAATCFSGALPLTIQNSTSWNKTGCYPGFQCQNATINILPQYCTPVEQCLHGRLGGADCGVPMGYFEPLKCPSGKYCPRDLGSGQPITCPYGSYCPAGSYQPVSCSAGSICHEGSIKDQTWLPLCFLVIVDIGLIVATFFAWIIKRRNDKRKNPGGGKPSRFSKIIRSMPQKRTTGYKTLDDDSIQLEPRVRSMQRAPTGFLGPMDDFQFDMHAAAYDASSKEDIDQGNTDLREFVGSLSKCIEGAQFGLSFEFDNLGFWPKGAPKPVLSNITGEISRGSLVGILGGSGAGKSTFVNVLMGKQKHTGSVKVNGVRDKLSHYKKIIGYVPQDDIVLAELTVRENILHSARIRLPSNWGDREIQRHVDILIDCLQLGHVKDSLVGSPVKPVISGGQRKRVSIGMELAAAPMALFLDEPTSGLDATAASHIMKILSALARLGITVVTIIHQPREEIFHAIDDLILLANGRLIYQGKERDVQGYFERAGFDFPEHSNPADTLMDIITGAGRPYKRAGDTSKESLIEHWANISTNRDSRGPSQMQGAYGEQHSLKKSIRRRGAPFYTQFYFCMLRSFLQQYRLKAAFWFEIGVASLAGFLIGLALNGEDGALFHGIYHDDYIYLSSSIDYQTLSILALLVAIALGLTSSAPGVKVFGEEKLTYRREAASGHNRFSYYMGKVIATLPRIILGCYHFTVFFMLLATPRIDWLKAFVVNLLYYYCIYGLASCVSMLTRREDGPLLATMASLIVGILSGFAPTLNQVAQWHMTWLWRASPGVWIAEVYYSENVMPVSYLWQIDDAAQALGLVFGRFWLDMVVLLGIGTTYRVIAFFLLILVRRSKQR
ncbi:ABC transporter-like protein [Rhizodiscina lignyota]|uniref:ABC transporter-like protein n=1 Tax=Rhizodiscina lignyota TaxID=1504668 RepID=A0A9P4IHG5_9PEZI|nr:ABC transporter-like protein [Rhizodiscina lignyota]